METIANRRKNGAALASMSVAVLCLIAAGLIPTAAQGQAGTGISSTVSAAGYFTQTNIYGWTLGQSVSPFNATLAPGSSQQFTHTLTACRTQSGQQTSGFGVQGQVCVANAGSVATANLQIVAQVQDQVGGGAYQNLGGAVQRITPATQIAAEGSQCYSYNIPFTPVPGAAYRVVASVTVTNHSGSQTSGPSPKSAGFTLTGPTQTLNIDDQATVTDALQPLSCSGFTTTDTLASPASWNIQSVGAKGCATTTFTVGVTNASSGGAAGCPLMDMAILTGNTTQTQLAQASATVTFCYLTQRLDSCLQDEGILEAFIYPGGAPNGNGVQASFLSDLLNKINQVRASVSTKKNPVPPLLRIVPLETAAQGYSQTLVGTDPTMLSHTLDGSDPTTRVMSTGYSPTTTVGENLAAGQWSAQEVITAWIATPESYANLINPQFTEVGLGLAGGATGRDAFVLYWVADFGSSTQNYPGIGGSAGSAIGVRAVVAQLDSDLQMADAALCAGNIPALTSDLDQGFVNYWVSQNLLSYSPAQSENVGVCLDEVLGFYSSTNGADYSPASSYIQTHLVE